MKMRHILVFLASISHAIFAEPIGLTNEQAIVTTKSAKLSEHPVWLQLLKIPLSRGQKSEVITREFFLSEQVEPSAEEELVATIEAYNRPHTGDLNKHPRCQFPARYYWLASQITLQEKPIFCKNLEQWAKFDQLESISLMQVSGYFGNPASTFGHILMKLNNGGGGDLLDQGINYGALIPEDEATFTYVLKGLFGGYVAGFSDRKFYTQDLVYTQTQSRDMWEYELQLTDSQQKLLVYHMWELLGKKHTYYFLKQNCGYRIAELLELVTQQPFIGKLQQWYLPVSVFHTLEDLAQKQQDLIKNVKFVPSSQRLLYERFARLGKPFQAVANRLINQPDQLTAELESIETQQEQQLLINVLLDYYKYKIAPYEESEIPKNLVERKKELLLLRLSLPVEIKHTYERAYLPESPARGSNPGLIGLTLVTHDDNGGLEMDIAAVDYDTVGNTRGSLEYSKLKVLDTTLGFNADGGWYLDHLDIINIEKIDVSDTEIVGEKSRSWKVSTGIQRRDRSCFSCSRFYIRGGTGQSFRMKEGLVGYLMIDGRLRSGSEPLAIIPNVGLITRWPKYGSASLNIAYHIESSDADNRFVVDIDGMVPFSRNLGVYLSAVHDKSTEVRLSLQYHW